MKLTFYKYQGTGNDFILIDDRTQSVNLSKEEIAKLCDRRFGIGADGLILLRLKQPYDFEMIYYNADGNISSMCGNGGRCLTAFAGMLGIIKDRANFIAIDGQHEAVIVSNEPCIVKLKMSDVKEIESNPEFTLLNTGSPHYIKFSPDVKKVNVVVDGRDIRRSKPFASDGVNVNFVEVENDNLFIRTYERGVEDETLSCGTGVTAGVLAAVSAGRVTANREFCQVRTPGGNLKVYFEKSGPGFRNVWLEGEAQLVFSGSVTL